MEDISMSNAFVVNFFATPIPDYSKEIERLSMIETPNPVFDNK